MEGYQVWGLVVFFAPLAIPVAIIGGIILVVTISRQRARLGVAAQEEALLVLDGKTTATRRDVEALIYRLERYSGGSIRDELVRRLLDIRTRLP